VYWTNQNVIDRAVDAAGETSVNVGRAVYDHVDQGVIDNLVNWSGQASDRSGEELRHIQTGKVQQYAAIFFAGAALLAGAFIVYLSL
jgi:NADH:ubiquinone oxidoreductase subunit 5 (subunit L)/multisubunit Na+/H+ antiporter MnhA subunit